MKNHKFYSVFGSTDMDGMYRTEKNTTFGTTKFQEKDKMNPTENLFL